MVQEIVEVETDAQASEGSQSKSLKGPDDGTESTASARSSEPNSSTTSPERESSQSADASPSSAPKSKPKMPSIGSAPHASGQCSPCCFFPRGRCSNGQSCAFCHFDHEKRRHKKKGTGETAVQAQKSQAPVTETPSHEIFALPPMGIPPPMTGMPYAMPPPPQLPPWATPSEHAAAQIVADAWARRAAYPPDMWPKVPAVAPPTAPPSLEPAALLGILGAKAEAPLKPPPGLEISAEPQSSKPSNLENDASDRRLEDLFQDLLKAELENRSSCLPRKDMYAPPASAYPPPQGLGLGLGIGMTPARPANAYPAALPPSVPLGPPGLSAPPPGKFSPGVYPSASLGNLIPGYPTLNMQHSMAPSVPPTAPPSMPPNFLPGRPHSEAPSLPAGQAPLGQPKMPAGPHSGPPSGPPTLPPNVPPSLPPGMPPSTPFSTSPKWEPPTMPPTISSSLPPSMAPSAAPSVPPSGTFKPDPPAHAAALKKAPSEKSTTGKKSNNKGVGKAGAPKKSA